MRPSVLLFAALLATSASADEVYLKSGGVLSGRIVNRTATAIEIDVGAGRITVQASTVVRVQDGRSALHEYEDRAGKLAPGDVDGWLALGDWASARALGTQAVQAYQRALAAAPDNARANEALGRVQVNGRWVSEEEGYQARGYVKFEGEWVTPAEHDAILRQRAAEGELEHARREADARVAEAEARTREAEQRTKEAEAQQATEGIPLWYAWGAGPTVWPAQPTGVPSLSRSFWPVVR